MGSRHGQQPAAAIVVESFQAPGSEEEQIPRKLQTLLSPLEDAVVNALKRTDAGWGFLASLLFSPENRKKLLLSVAALFILAAALLFVPMELRLSYRGVWLPPSSTGFLHRQKESYQISLCQTEMR